MRDPCRPSQHVNLGPGMAICGYFFKRNAAWSSPRWKCWKEETSQKICCTFHSASGRGGMGVGMNYHDVLSRRDDLFDNIHWFPGQHTLPYRKGRFIIFFFFWVGRESCRGQWKPDRPLGLYKSETGKYTIYRLFTKINTSNVNITKYHQMKNMK